MLASDARHRLRGRHPCHPIIEEALEVEGEGSISPGGIIPYEREGELRYLVSGVIDPPSIEGTVGVWMMGVTDDPDRPVTGPIYSVTSQADAFTDWPRPSSVRVESTALATVRACDES